MPYELDDQGLRIIGYNVPIRFYDPSRVLQAEIFLQRDGTLNVGGTVSSGSSGTSTGAHGLDDTNTHLGTLADNQAPQFLKITGSRTLTADWDAGSHKITAEQLESDIVTGTAPLIVASETLVDNLNADLLDGYEAAAFPRKAEAATITETWRFNQNVGILCDPDDQFALDVNGPIRGTYLVGSHAIQLDDALLIAHFDGARPYATDFSVDTTGHLGQVATASNVIGRPGKFGKAVEIAQGTVNLFDNPVFGTGDYTGYSYYAGSGGNGTATVGTGSVYVGEYALEMTADTAGTSQLSKGGLTTLDNGESLTISVYAESDDGARFGLNIYDVTNTTSHSSGVLTADDDYTHHTHTWTNNTGGTVTISFYMYFYDTDGTTKLRVGGLQAEKKAYATPVTYGDMPNSAWTSTAHASTSTRSAGSLYYTNPIDATEGTLGIWWQPFADYDDQPTSYLFDEGGLAAYFDSADYKINFTDGTNTAESSALDFSAGDWVHLVFTWSSSGLTIYIDGVADGTNGTYTAPTLGSNLYIGSSDTPDSQAGLLDDLVITESAMSADLVRAIYESSAPVFAETSISVWRSPTKVPIWVDSRGLWAEDADGNAVFGINVGQDSYSWGGITTSIGDIVFGHNQTDSAAMWWDIDTKRIKFLGDGSADVQVYIDTNGTLKAAGGTLILDKDTGITLSDAFSESGGGNITATPEISFLKGASQAATIYYEYDTGVLSLDPHSTLFIKNVQGGGKAGPEIEIVGTTRITEASGTGPSLTVRHTDTSGAVPVLELEQLDVSEEFIKFIGEAASGNLARSIVDAGDVSSNSIAGYVRVYAQDDGNQITDQAYYLPLYTLS